MSLVEHIWTSASGILAPMIRKYQNPGSFRDLVKSILTGNPDQICPCWVLHGPWRNCSSVIRKVAERKPRKLVLAIAVQRKRCQDAAAQIVASPELYHLYQSEQEEKMRKKREKTWNTCDDCATGMYCMDVGDCIPLGRTKSSCDMPDCTPGKCDLDCSPGGCDGCS